MDPTEAYIRQAALARGIDPDVAMRVAGSEGLNSYAGDNNSSFGPFQLHYGGVAPGGNAVSGLGDAFTASTGLDARDPKTVPQQIDFSLDHASKNGWGAWHGWKGDQFAGIQGKTPMADAMQQQPAPQQAPAVPPGIMSGLGGMSPALQDAGAYLMSASNPSALAGTNHTAEALKRLTPQFVDAGTDPFTGQKNFVWVNPATGKAVPANLSGANGAGNSGNILASGSMAAFRNAFAKGVTGDELAKTLPPEVASYVKSLREGRAIPGNMGRGGPGRMALMNVAHAIDPTMDETNIQARQLMAKSMDNPSPNQLGGQIISANTLMNHTSLLQNDIDNLEKLGVTGKSPAWNYLKQGAESNIPGLFDEKTQAALASFNKHKQAVASELTRLTRGSNGSLQEVQDWKNGLNASDSIAALRSGTAAVVDLMHGRVQAGIDGYNRAMNKNTPVEDYLSAPAKAAIAKIGEQTAQYAPGAATPTPAAPSLPKVGEVRSGWKFKGGVPGDKTNWEKQ